MVGVEDGGLVRLSSGPLELALSPETGGSIARFDYIAGGGAVPIFRGCKGTPTHALETGSFPLVPYVNRIRGGRFSFRGREIRIAPNMSGDPSPLHGQGWLNSWRVADVSQNQATIEFEHEAGEWPWAYLARQHLKLDEGGLSIELSCRNRSAELMPCGLGQHPYFHCSPQTRIATHVAEVWTIDEQVLPVERVAAVGRYDLSDGPVCGLGLDHGFGGWGGRASFSDPNWPFTIDMTSANAAYFQLYSPRDGGLFVAEPVTHANAALNEPEEQWAALGMRILAPGEEMRLNMRLEIRG